MYRRRLNGCQKNRRTSTQAGIGRNTQCELMTQKKRGAKTFISKSLFFYFYTKIFSLGITIKR